MTENSDAPGYKRNIWLRGLFMLLMASYLRQVVNFLTFATEEMPFPFSEWPAGE